MERENPFFRLKGQIAASLAICPRAPLFPKKTTKELAALWTLGKGVGFGCFCFLSCVIGIDVRNGSGEHSVFRRLLSVVEVT